MYKRQTLRTAHGINMRILGLDFGSKTVGVAVSDELLITAQAVSYTHLDVYKRQT